MEFFLHYGRIEISKCHRLPRVHGLRLSGKKVSSPSAWAAALGEEDVFPECPDSGSRGRGCLPRVLGLQRSEKRVSSPSAWVAALGEEGVFPECCTWGRLFFLNKEMAPAVTNGVNSSSGARTALGKAFLECTIFGSRRRRLSHGEIPRKLIPKYCTRGKLPRVQLGLHLVHLTLGEVTVFP